PCGLSTARSRNKSRKRSTNARWPKRRGARTAASPACHERVSTRLLTSGHLASLRRYISVADMVFSYGQWYCQQNTLWGIRPASRLTPYVDEKEERYGIRGRSPVFAAPSPWCDHHSSGQRRSARQHRRLWRVP